MGDTRSMSLEKSIERAIFNEDRSLQDREIGNDGCPVRNEKVDQKAAESVCHLRSVDLVALYDDITMLLTLMRNFSTTSSRSFRALTRGPLLTATRVRSRSAMGFNQASEGSVSMNVSINAGETVMLASKGERLFRTACPSEH